MDNNQRLGFLLSFFGAVIGIVGGLGLFIFTYEPYIIEEMTNLAAESGCEVIIKDFLPYIFDLSFIGGILFALSIPIGLIFLYYLTRPHVKAYFGKN